MEDKFSLEDLRTHLAEVETEMRAMNDAYDGRDFDPEAQDKWDTLKDERSKAQEAITRREEREQYVAGLARNERNVEDEPKQFSFHTRRASAVPDDPTNLDEYRVRARSLDELERAYVDGARKIVDSKRFEYLHPAAKREDVQGDIERLSKLDREVALRVITTSTPGYAREFEQYVKMGAVGPEMQRAASLTTTAGGFAVPVELDTTLMITNAGAISPIRNIARVRQTNRNTVEFINTAGITAAFAAEAAEASDNAPTLAQPTAYVERAQAFVPMSIEIAEDWANIQADMAMAFGDAKERLESDKYLKGLGHSSTQPQGLIAAGGATAVVTSASTATIAAGDLYSLELGLSPRFRARASIVANKAFYQKVRQLDTQGGANLWVQLQFGDPGELLGYPAYEWSDYSSAVTTSASTVATIGDFSYFAIVDRVGMNVEYVPHLFGTVSNFPTGQRGLFTYWRTGSQILSPTLSANSAFVSLKLL